MKFKFTNEDIDKSTHLNQNSGGAISQYYQQADCFIWLKSFQIQQASGKLNFDEKSFKNNDLTQIKAWIETRQRKKQEWMVIVCIQGSFNKEYSDVSDHKSLNIIEKSCKSSRKNEESNANTKFKRKFNIADIKDNIDSRIPRVNRL